MAYESAALTVELWAQHDSGCCSIRPMGLAELDFVLWRGLRREHPQSQLGPLSYSALLFSIGTRANVVQLALEFRDKSHSATLCRAFPCSACHGKQVTRL